MSVAPTPSPNPPRNTLTPAQKTEISDLFDKGTKKADIAKQVGCSLSTVNNVLNKAANKTPVKRGSRGAAPSVLTPTNYGSPAPAQSANNKRLVAFAVATIMGDPIDPAEGPALKLLIDSGRQAARQAALQKADEDYYANL